MSATREVNIHVRLSDVLGCTVESGKPVSREDVLDFWTDAVNEKIHLLGGLRNYLDQFMDSYQFENK